VPSRGAVAWRAGSLGGKHGGHDRYRADGMRAVFPRLPVCAMGRQIGRRGTRGGHAGMPGRSLGVNDIPPLLLVGCGRMGSAMLAGGREGGLRPSFAVDPAPEAAMNSGADLTVIAELATLPTGFAPAAVVLAVKPQSAAEALPAYARFAGSAVFLSI